MKGGKIENEYPPLERDEEEKVIIKTEFLTTVFITFFFLISFPLVNLDFSLKSRLVQKVDQ